MKFSFSNLALATALVAFPSPLLAYGPGASNDFGGKRVLIIGIDGLRTDAMQAAKTPHINALTAKGVITYNAFSGGTLGDRTEQPTISGPGWCSILLGVYADKHKIKGNNFSAYDREISKEYPHFFRRIKTAFPKAYVASISSWGSIEDSIVVPNASCFNYHAKGTGAKYPDRDLDVTNKTVEQLKTADPDVLFVHFDQVDGAGHATGFTPENPVYIKAIEDTDALIGNVMQAIQARPQYNKEQWLVVLTTDHGGTVQGGHGGQSPEERTIPMLVSGNIVEGAHVSTESPGLASVPPTVMKYLGIPVKDLWNWEADAFGYPPYLQTAVTKQGVKLEWKLPKGGLPGLTGIEIFCDGKSIRTLGATETQYSDKPGTGDHIYEIHFRGTSEGRTSHVRVQGELNENLVLHLPFDGSSQDLSGKSHHGTINGKPSYNAGKRGQCLDFTVTTPRQYVSISRADALEFGPTDSFTISVWLNHTGTFANKQAEGGSAEDPAIISNKDWLLGTKTGWYIGAGPDGRWQWNIGDGKNRADYDSPASRLSDGKWHHLCVVHDRTRQQASLYYDGTLAATRPIGSIGTLKSTMPIAIATDGTFGAGLPNWFDGKIDDVKIWRRALLSSEVSTVFNQ